MGCSPPGSLVHGDSLGKNAGVGNLSLLQGIFPTQESNWSLLHFTLILYQLSYLGLLSRDQNDEGPRGSCSLRSSDWSCGQLGGREYCEVLSVLRRSLSGERWRESQPCSGSWEWLWSSKRLLGGPHIAVLLNQKSFLSPEDIWQCLESFWMVTISAGEKG